MRTSMLAIGIYSDHVEVALCRRGRIVDVRRRDLATLTDTTVANVDWTDRIQGVGSVLQGMICSLTRGGDSDSSSKTSRSPIFKHRAMVVYESPSAIVDCYSMPMRNPAQAKQAAMLAAAEAFPATEHIITSAYLIERFATLGSAPRQSESSRKEPAVGSRVLAIAESEHLVTLLRAVVEQAGVSFGGAIPSAALVAAAAAAHLPTSLLAVSGNGSSHEDTHTPVDTELKNSAITALLHIAETGSFLIIRNRRGGSNSRGGTVRFTRTISIGTETLAQSLQTSTNRLQQRQSTAEPAGAPSGRIQSKSSTHQTTSLSLDAARSALFECGLPDPSSSSALHKQHETTKLTGRDILPSIQPHLQRALIELRQSMRFALEPSERSRVKLVVTGPGSAIPGFADALARELDVPVFIENVDSEVDTTQNNNGSSPSSLLSTLAAGASTWLGTSAMATTIQNLLLQPSEMVMRQTVDRVRNALWLGAAAAVLLLVLDANRLEHYIAEAKQSDIASTAVYESARLAESAGHIPPRNPEDMVMFIETGQKFRKAVERELAHTVNLRAAMHELTNLTPQSIRFSTLTIQNVAQGSRPVGIISGMARDHRSGPARAALDRFMQLLQSSPLFDDVSLASVQAAQDADGSGRRFEIRVALNPNRTQPFKNISMQLDSQGDALPSEGESPTHAHINHGREGYQR